MLSLDSTIPELCTRPLQSTSDAHQSEEGKFQDTTLEGKLSQVRIKSVCSSEHFNRP